MGGFFSKTVPIAGLTKNLNEMIFIFFINICLINFFFVNFFAKKIFLNSTKYNLVKLRICNPFNFFCFNF